MKIKPSCWFCHKHITPAKTWTIKLKSQYRPFGVYCSERCAKDDSWGPLFWDSAPVKLKDLSI